jgi:hypothetical protein
MQAAAVDLATGRLLLAATAAVETQAKVLWLPLLALTGLVAVEVVNAYPVLQRPAVPASSSCVMRYDHD